MNYPATAIRSKQSQALASPFARLLAVLGTCLLAACAASSGRVAATSPIASLGAPQMIPTTLGRLAVWDTATDASSAKDQVAIVLWPSIFTDHVIYSTLVEHWRGKHRLILIDGPGHGASEGLRDKTYSMQACAQAMKAVLDAKGISSAVVGGTSWGGIVGGEFALTYPQATRAVIMMNTPFYTEPGGPSMAERMITWGSGTLLGTRIFTSGIARSFFLPQTREAGGIVIEHFHDSLHHSDSAALSHAIRSVLIERIALADRLPQITAPALVIAGRQDAMYPMEMQRAAVAKLPRGTLEMVDSQHISVVDRPQEVAQIMDRFVDKVLADKP